MGTLSPILKTHIQATPERQNHESHSAVLNKKKVNTFHLVGTITLSLIEEVLMEFPMDITS